LEDKVVIYQLTHKFVNEEQDVPEEPRQVIYYSLAIGHHVGVMDCFQPLASLPLEEFRCWVEALPEGVGRSKLEGLLKFGEIEINHSHAADLLPCLWRPASSAAVNEKPEWQTALFGSLQAMLREPALYLMLKRME